MNHSNNKHHRETSRRIEEILLDLLKEKKIEKITVREICEKSGINASTFYRHYIDIYDLLDKIADRTNNEILSLYKNDTEEGTLSGFSEEKLLKLLDYVKTNLSFFRVYLEGYPAVYRQKKMHDLFEVYCYPIFRAAGVNSTPHMNYYYRYFISGLNAAISYWLERDCLESTEELAGIIKEMMYRGDKRQLLTDNPVNGNTDEKNR